MKIGGFGLKKHFTHGSDLKVDEDAMKDESRPFYAAAVAAVMNELERSIAESQQKKHRKKDKKNKKKRRQQSEVN